MKVKKFACIALDITHPTGFGLGVEIDGKKLCTFGIAVDRTKVLLEKTDNHSFLACLRQWKCMAEALCQFAFYKGNVFEFN